MTTDIQTAAIIGAGTMGPDVAAIFARHGLDVRLQDVNPEALARARKGVASVYQTLTEAGRMTAAEAEAALDRITFTAQQAEALAGVEFVLEAIPEKLELKHTVFKEIEAQVGDEVILASNSSGIPIGRIAEAARRPERVIGTHWLNQPHVIPVIEVIQGPQTSEATVAATRQLLERLGMVPVLIRGDLPGFVHNRILFAIYREVLHMLEEGVVSAEDIDNVTKWAIGPKLTAVGPFEMLDVAGLDVYQNIAAYLNPDLSDSSQVSQLIRDRVEQGQTGLKAGRGLYAYEPEAIPSLMQQRRRLMLDVVRLRQESKGGG